MRMTLTPMLTLAKAGPPSSPRSRQYRLLPHHKASKKRHPITLDWLGFSTGASETVEGERIHHTRTHISLVSLDPEYA
jgi:hypothetical protein